jgi:hypothetical protein
MKDTKDTIKDNVEVDDLSKDHELIEDSLDVTEDDTENPFDDIDFDESDDYEFFDVLTPNYNEVRKLRNPVLHQ